MDDFEKRDLQCRIEDMNSRLSREASAPSVVPFGSYTAHYLFSYRARDDPPLFEHWYDVKDSDGRWYSRLKMLRGTIK